MQGEATPKCYDGFHVNRFLAGFSMPTVSDHNRVHAADVLHAVYWLTTQPVPGLKQVPQAQIKTSYTDVTKGTLHRACTCIDFLLV